MANLPISGLTASASNLASTDVAPVVQTTGVGPVKMTGLQLAGGLLGAASFNGATVTTSQPVLNLSQTWNAGAVTFTGLKFNATDTASAAGSLLLDLQTGGVSKLSVDKNGNTTIVNSLRVATSVALNYYASGVQTNGPYALGATAATTDTYISRAAAATLQLGAADAAAPVAQTLQVQSVVSGSPANTAGANFTIKGSAGNGNGAGGSIIFQVAPAGTAGVQTQNAYATALTIGSDKGATFANYVSAVGASNSGVAFSVGDIGVSSGFGVSATRPAIFFNGTAYMRFTSGTTITGFPLVFGSDATSNLDTILVRDAANTLALRNGTTAQTYRIYATTDSPVTNFQRLTLSAGVTANMAIVAADNGGTGIAMGLQFGAALTTGGGVTNIMNINTSGHLVWNTDNTYDIGASGANRPRNLYLGSAIIASGSGAGLQIVNGASYTYVYPTYVSTTGDYKFYNNSGTITFGASSDIILSRSAAGVLKVAGASSAGGTVLHNGYTFSTLPTGAAGMVAYISDASNAAPAFGDTVSAGGGTTKVLCWYNGTNWTVIGK